MHDGSFLFLGRVKSYVTTYKDSNHFPTAPTLQIGEGRPKRPVYPSLRVSAAGVRRDLTRDSGACRGVCSVCACCAFVA